MLIWGVDLIGAAAQQPRAKADPSASRRPRCTVVDTILYAPASGRLVALPFKEGSDAPEELLNLDLHAEIGKAVQGPEAVFATSLAEIVVSGRNLRQARAVTAQLLGEPPRIDTTATVAST